MEHHWESGLSVLVRHALAPKAAAAGGPIAVVVGLVEEVEEVDGVVDTKLLVSYGLQTL